MISEQDLLLSHAREIYKGAIRRCLPDSAVKEALSHLTLPEGRLILVSIGKAAWKMASTAVGFLGDSVTRGIVITKYEHSEGDIPGIEIYEAGHPVPDENGIKATERALSMTESLTERDTVLFLVSGGGSALFESPLCTLSELRELTESLLASGASINEVNTVRKHISKVKGGRFAEWVYPAKIFGVVLSDVLGNSLDTIASGPAAPDTGTVSDVKFILQKYGITVSPEVMKHLMTETPKRVENAEHYIGGSVSELCIAARDIAESLGYKTEILSDSESGEAFLLGSRLGRIAADKRDTDTPLAFIAGGECVVKLKGKGKGGRNQETALSAALEMRDSANAAVFSIGSDGTDGPTDAAGGFVTADTYRIMCENGIDPEAELKDNNSYYALGAVDSLIFTGATGTNVNDVAVVLVRPIKK